MGIGKIARRSFLIGSAAIAGGVAFGYWKYRQPYDNPLLTGLPDGAVALTPYVIVDGNGVTVIAPRAEMGQGIHTTLAALVAEEMDLVWDQVQVLHGPASKAYFNAAVLEEGVPFAPTDDSWMAETARGAMHVPAKFLALQITGGSTSIPDGFDKMRKAGAAARAALIGAAARRLRVADSALSTEAGMVIAPDGQRIPYTDLAVEAAGIALPDDPALKPRDQWALLGASLPRKDMVGKATGTATYAIDVRLPGMRFATVRTNPRLGGGLTSHDAAEALAMPGVDKVVPVTGGVAVVAANTWAAFQAADRIAFDWGPAPYPADTEAMRAEVAASFTDDRQDSRLRDDGDVAAEIGTDVFEASYEVPYLAHATMEPMNAAVWIHDGKVEVWAGNQLPTQVVIEAARITGLPEAAVEVHTTVMGGGFGRRAEMDVIRHALEVAVTMDGTPVLVTYSREEDTTHDAYRPMAMARVRGALRDGKVHALDLSLAAPSVSASMMGRLGYPAMGPDATIVQGAWEQPYAFPNYRVTGYRVPAGVPVGFWRSVGASQNAFFHESAVDELAHAAGADPLQFRLNQIDHAPSRAVIEAVRDMSGWQTPLPQGRARGAAFCLSFGVPVAQVIEIEDTPGGIALRRAFIAADVGIPLDPRNIEAQLSGGMIFGLSAAMMGEITFADGMAQQANFYDYDALRLGQTPEITVRVLGSGGKIRGVGEPGTPPAAPALANAIFALTGQRLRTLPLNKAVSFA